MDADLKKLVTSWKRFGIAGCWTTAFLIGIITSDRSPKHGPSPFSTAGYRLLVSLLDPPSDTGLRRTVAVRFSAPTMRLLQVVSHALFDGAYTSTVEVAFLEFALLNGFLGEPPAPVPIPGHLASSQETGASVDQLLGFVDVLSSRLESMARQGRVAIVDHELVLAFVSAGATFPGPIDSFETAPTDFVEQEYFSFTLEPRQIDLIEEVGLKLYGRDRKRRAVIETALVRMAELHGLSDVQQTPTFAVYPEARLIPVTRHFTRHTRTLLAALDGLAPAVGQYRLWSAIEAPWKAATKRLGNALFHAVKRDGPT